jgi:hypothetical protein
MHRRTSKNPKMLGAHEPESLESARARMAAGKLPL